MPEWQKFLWIAGAGAVGAIARWQTGELVKSFVGESEAFPWGILLINLLSCFFFGLVLKLFDKSVIHAEARLVILIGFLGTYSTFSTFAADTALLMQKSSYLTAALNVIAQIALGVAAIFAGLAVGGWWKA